MVSKTKLSKLAGHGEKDLTMRLRTYRQMQSAAASRGETLLSVKLSSMIKKAETELAEIRRREW